MHARVVVARAQLLVLDPVEMARLAQQRKESFLPGGLDQRAQVLDGLQARISRQDQLDRETIVDIDQEGHLLLAAERREARRRDGGPFGQHLLQNGALGQETGIVDARLLVVGQPLDVLFQQGVPETGPRPGL